MSNKANHSLSIGRLLKNAAVRYRGKEAVFSVNTGRRLSYLELNERTNRLANALTDRGFRKGDLLAFLITNRSETIETYFAIAKLGLIGLPLNYRLNVKEIARIMKFAGARALVFEDTFAGVADFLNENHADVKKFICVGKNESGNAEKYEDLIAGAAAAEPEGEVDEADVFYMNLTSGTTGLPKAYYLRHYNNAAAIFDFTQMFSITEKDTVLTVFPMFGRVGFAWTGASILNGAKHVIMNFEPRQAMEVVQSEKITVSNWVPAMANFVLALPDVAKYDTSSLRGLIFAGSSFPVSLQEDVAKRLCPNVYEYYGMQETGIIINASPEDKRKNRETIGKVSPWADVRVFDASGKEATVGTIGEIAARALSCITEYYKDDEKTKESFRGGWCFTGDLGHFDDQGYLYLSGRIKDMIVTGGQNVFAAEVENCLMACPDVEDCAVIGLPDAKWGEAVAAVIVKKPDSKATETDVIDYCKKEIAGFKVPKKIIFIDGQLPRTPSGKVQKFILVDKYSK